MPLGVSSAVADVLFETARQALHGVLRFNERLFARLDVERFFYCVRPYYKPYRVGRQEYRGANAGDFSGINEIDLLLGLCRASDPYYAQLLVDKMLFMLPEDQARLRACMTYRSLMDEFLAVVDSSRGEAWFQANAGAFLEVCDLFGRTAVQHHDLLVKRFIEAPAAQPRARASSGIDRERPAAARAAALARNAARPALGGAARGSRHPASRPAADQERADSRPPMGPAPQRRTERGTRRRGRPPVAYTRRSSSMLTGLKRRDLYMRNHHDQFFIDGAWVAPARAATLDVINPATEQAYTRISLGAAADVDRAVAAAKAAFPAFSRTTREERLALLRKILELYNAQL